MWLKQVFQAHTWNNVLMRSLVSSNINMELPYSKMECRSGASLPGGCGGTTPLGVVLDTGKIRENYDIVK